MTTEFFYRTFMDRKMLMYSPPPPSPCGCNDFFKPNITFKFRPLITIQNNKLIYYSTTLQLYSSTIIQLYNTTALQLYSSTALQLYNSTALPHLDLSKTCKFPPSTTFKIQRLGKRILFHMTEFGKLKDIPT